MSIISVEVDISELHNLNDILSCLTCDDHAEKFQLKIDINFTIQDDVSTAEQMRIYSVLANSVDMIHKSADATSVEITPTPETLQLCSEIVKLVATEQLRPTIIFNPATTDVISDFMRNCVHCPMSIKADLTELSSAVGTIPHMSIIDSAVKQYHIYTISKHGIYLFSAYIILNCKVDVYFKLKWHCIIIARQTRQYIIQVM